MALHREALENRFNYFWGSEPIYLQIHETSATWIPGAVEPEETSATEILESRLLGAAVDTYNTTLDQLDFTLDATFNNTTGANVTFNRISIWRGTDADIGVLGNGTVGNGGTEITLDSTPPGNLVNGSRILLSSGVTYLQATASTVTGSLLTLSNTVSGSFNDGDVVKVVGGVGLFVGTTQLPFNASVGIGENVTITITGSNLLQ